MQPPRIARSGWGVGTQEIWRKHKDDLVRYATALAGPSDAEDVVSTVVVKALRRGGLDDLDHARPYLFRAVLNEARTRRRRGLRRRSQYELPESPPDPRPEVLAAVLRLPMRQRAATYLVYWEDRSVAETARLMAVGPGTVKRYLYLARRTLRGVLDDS